MPYWLTAHRCAAGRKVVRCRGCGGRSSIYTVGRIVGPLVGSGRGVVFGGSLRSLPIVRGCWRVLR